MTKAAPRRRRPRVIYRGRVFTIEVGRVRLPHGIETTMEVVRHRGSVVLIPQPTPATVILIRQYRPVIGRWIWELPAGSLEAGEAIGRAARRECEEEIGLRPGKIERLLALYPTPGFCDELMTFYRCTRLARPARPAAGDADELIEPKEFTVDDAWRLVDRGDVLDMKTVVGLELISRRGARHTRARRRLQPPRSAGR